MKNKEKKQRSISSKQRKNRLIRFKNEKIKRCEDCRSFFNSVCLETGNKKYKIQQSCYLFKNKMENENEKK